jgi:biopolymer transport protein ExbD
MNMTPMIDIVFQLLIFFMTCSQVSETQRELLELPKLRGSQDQTRGEITVNIRADGSVWLGGEQANVPAVVAFCSDEIERLHAGAPEALRVVLRTDRRSQSRSVNEIVSALSQLGVRKVRVAVQTE